MLKACVEPLFHIAEEYVVNWLQRQKNSQPPIFTKVMASNVADDEAADFENNTLAYFGVDDDGELRDLINKIFPEFNFSEIHLLEVVFRSAHFGDGNYPATATWRRFKVRLSAALNYNQIKGVMYVTKVDASTERVVALMVPNSHLQAHLLRVTEMIRKITAEAYRFRDCHTAELTVRDSVFDDIETDMIQIVMALQQERECNSRCASSVSLNLACDVLRYGVRKVYQGPRALANDYLKWGTYRRDGWEEYEMFRSHGMFGNTPPVDIDRRMSILHWMKTGVKDQLMQADKVKNDGLIRSDNVAINFNESEDEDLPNDVDQFTQRMRLEITQVARQYYIVSQFVYIPYWRLKTNCYRSQLKEFWDYSLVTIKWVDLVPLELTTLDNPFM